MNFDIKTSEDRKAELDELLAKANARYEAMTPDEKAAMHKAQRESFIRAMRPCEHGDPDWETCPECLTIYASH